VIGLPSGPATASPNWLALRYSMALLIGPLSAGSLTAASAETAMAVF
jgi:hypothetical protein